MTQELFANPVTPGIVSVIGTLGSAITGTSSTTILMSQAAPVALQATGQFRILIDSELMIVTAGAATTSFTVTRGAEGSTAATHLAGVNVYHVVTAAALRTFLQLANNLSDLASASTARTNLGLGTAAVANTTAFDAAGLAATETTRAMAAEATELARAMGAEALLAPITTPTFLGNPKAPTPTTGNSSTSIATTAFIAATNALVLASPNSPVTANYQIQASDGGFILELTSGSAINLTFPTGLGVGLAGEIFQYGAGQGTIVAAGGVTLRSDGGLVHTGGLYSTVGWRVRASNEVVLSGDLA